MTPEETGAHAPGPIRRQIHGHGVDLAVTELGDRGRPTVLLVHGFPDTGAVWAPVAQLLATGFHVVAYDVRGAGDSSVPATHSGYALPLQIADMAAVIAEVCPDSPVHLVGHDWGSIQGWEAVTSDLLAGRIASYTSISGPPIEHAALWARRHRTRQLSDLRVAVRQASHSWYIVLFHLPLLPQVVAGSVRVQRRLSDALRRRPGRSSDDLVPRSTLGEDFAHGLGLYRANVRQRFRYPTKKHSETPVQIIVPMADRYVTPALLEGLEDWAALVWRRESDAGHWIIRTHPEQVAAWVREIIAFVDDGSETDDMARCRVPLPADVPSGSVAT